jgi:hypothetical protein
MKGTMSSVDTKVVVRSGCGCHSCLFEDRVLLHARAFPSGRSGKKGIQGHPVHASLLSNVHTEGKIQGPGVPLFLTVDYSSI